MNISEYRARKGLSRKQLAEIIGVSAEFLRLHENGKRQFSPQRAIQVDELTGGEVPKHETRPDIWTGEAAA